MKVAEKQNRSQRRDRRGNTRRTACKKSIVDALRNMDGQCRIPHLFGVFHLFYRRNHYATVRRVTPLLAEMEHDGLVSCTYSREGLVFEVFLVGTQRGNEITEFRGSDGEVRTDAE